LDDFFPLFISTSFAPNSEAPFSNALILAPKLNRVFTRVGELELIPHQVDLFHNQFTTLPYNMDTGINLFRLGLIYSHTGKTHGDLAD